VAELIAAIARSLPGLDELGTPAEPAGVVVHRLGADRDSFSVEREDGAYRVRGRRIERIVAQTDFENEESAARFQRDLERFGIERELRRAGVGSGDLVRIGAHELEWDAEPWE
jgi:GTP-binding protein